jgi:hypothetical protein
MHWVWSTPIPKKSGYFSSGQLSSNERLYFSLWGNKLLSTASFDAKKFSRRRTLQLPTSFVSGQLLAKSGAFERLGPGSVLCLAEGLARTYRAAPKPW